MQYGANAPYSTVIRSKTDVVFVAGQHETTVPLTGLIAPVLCAIATKWRGMGAP